MKFRLVKKLLPSCIHINNILELPGYNPRTYTPILCDFSQFSPSISAQQNSSFLTYDIYVSAKQNNITSTDDNLLYLIQFQSNFLTLFHKREGRGFDFISLEFFMDSIAPAADSVSNRNEYQEYFLGGGGGKGGGARGVNTFPPL